MGEIYVQRVFFLFFLGGRMGNKVVESRKFWQKQDNEVFKFEWMENRSTVIFNDKLITLQLLKQDDSYDCWRVFL